MFSTGHTAPSWASGLAQVMDSGKDADFSPFVSSLRRPTRLALVVVLCGALLGCGVFRAGPPAAVVEQALAQKLLQAQSLLRSQLASEEPPTSFVVGKVKISDQHPVTVGNRSAVEVEGTYTLKGGNLSRAQRRQARPFDIYLQRGAENDQWFLLEPAPQASPSQWQAVPLS